jgi:hypothetical protein
MSTGDPSRRGMLKKLESNVTGFTGIVRGRRYVLDSNRAFELGVGAMPSSKPLQWIEQAEAREVITDAMSQRAPAPSRRKLPRVALAEWLGNLRRRIFSLTVPEWLVLQAAQPVLVRSQDRRGRPVGLDRDY